MIFSYLPFSLSKLYYAIVFFLLDYEPIEAFLSFFCRHKGVEDILKIGVITKSHIDLIEIGPFGAIGANVQQGAATGNIALPGFSIDVECFDLYLDKVTA